METKRPRRRTKLVLIVVLVLALVGAGSFGVYRYNRPVPALAISIMNPTIQPQTVDLPWTESGESAISTLDNKVLGTGANADKVVPTASIAKLITILTVLKKYPLNAGESGPTLTMGQYDVDRYNYYNAIDGSTAAVTVGEKITEYQMLQAMLLPSANNMADSLAVWAYGSLGNYRAAAQDMVNKLGMGRTLVGSDASGFLPDTTSTASDLVHLGQAAIKRPVIAEIAAQKVANIPVEGTIYNTNLDLGSGDFTGLKTGTSDQAGNCFLFTATHTFTNGQKETFVGAILDSPTEQSRFGEATTLLDATYAGYKDATLASAGKSIGTVKSAWGASTNVAPLSDVKEFVWSGDKEAATTNVSVANKTSLKSNDQVGTLKVGSDSTPLVTTSKLNPPSFWWRIFH